MLVSTDAKQAGAAAVLGAVRAYTSHDVVAHANSLSSWQQQYDQLVGGAFQGALEELWFEDVQVFRERTSHAVRQICRIREDAVWCGVTVMHDGSRIEGQEVGHDGVMVCGHGAEFELLTPDGHEIFGIVASRNALLQHADAVGVSLDAGLLNHASWLPCGSEAQSRLRHCLAFLLHHAPMSSAPGAALATGLRDAATQRLVRAQQAALDAFFDVLTAPAHQSHDLFERAG